MCVRNPSLSVEEEASTKEDWLECLDPSSEPEFYMSVVFVTRMDNYAGNQLHRLQNLIDSTVVLAERTMTPMEIIIVEWNPRADRRRVVEVANFRPSPYLEYRVITVPPEIHDIVPAVGDIPVHEFEGKNVGIRFARGEFVLCTNQDDIWSQNFHNAVEERMFEKNAIYLQHQDYHNIHQNYPKSIVNLPAFPTDDMLYDACNLVTDVEGPSLPVEIDLSPANALYYCDQAGDFTLAHRDTWKMFQGYREAGGTGWMDIEAIATAAWIKNVKIMYSHKGFACHQDHENVWESYPDRMTDNKNISLNNIYSGETVLLNEEGQWGLQQYDIWELGLQCIDFSICAWERGLPRLNQIPSKR